MAWTPSSMALERPNSLNGIRERMEKVPARCRRRIQRTNTRVCHAAPYEGDSTGEGEGSVAALVAAIGASGTCSEWMEGDGADVSVGGEGSGASPETPCTPPGSMRPGSGPSDGGSSGADSTTDASPAEAGSVRGEAPADFGAG